MARGLLVCGLIAVWALLQTAETGSASDHKRILVAAVFSGAAMCGALSVVLAGRTASRTPAQIAITAALLLPCLLGLYLGLYRGLWGARDLVDDLSMLVFIRTLALSAIGYALVTVAGQLTRSVLELTKSSGVVAAPNRHHHAHS